MSFLFQCTRYLLSLGLGVAAGAAVAEVRVAVSDQHGQPVPNALVFVADAAGEEGGNATIEQRDLEFHPRFSAIRVGTTVRFPNHDRSRHHVYSFSPAKTFELKLYRGETADPVTFDAPGIVTLGCNVHDWMAAWVYVVDSAAWRLTDASGVAVLDAAADRVLEVWHPFLRAPVTLTAPGGADRELSVTLREDIVIPARPDDADNRPSRRRPRAP